LYEGTTPIEPPKSPAEGYHLTEDLTDKAINWVRQQQALVGDKPFFMYFAPGATHAPHHVPKEWIDKYKGKFAYGWDRQREITFERQKKLGVVGPDAVLTPRDPEIPGWDDMDPALKPVLEREMEVYAAFMEHTDHHVRGARTASTTRSWSAAVTPPGGRSSSTTTPATSGPAWPPRHWLACSTTRWLCRSTRRPRAGWWRSWAGCPRVRSGGGSCLPLRR
jgi:hypothetical protein